MTNTESTDSTLRAGGTTTTTGSSTCSSLATTSSIDCSTTMATDRSPGSLTTIVVNERAADYRRVELGGLRRRRRPGLVRLQRVLLAAPFHERSLPERRRRRVHASHRQRTQRPGRDTLGSCWADYDNDGFADLFLANADELPLSQRRRRHVHPRQRQRGRRGPDSCVASSLRAPGATTTTTASSISIVTAVDLAVATPHRPGSFLYHNDGDGTFTKVTEGPVVTDRIDAARAAELGRLRQRRFPGSLRLARARSARRSADQPALSQRWQHQRLAEREAGRHGLEPLRRSARRSASTPSIVARAAGRCARSPAATAKATSRA